MKILETKTLSIGYGRRIVQENLDLSACEGQLICLLGTNGCGKSTLLRTLSGLQKSLGGEVFINGVSLAKMDDQTRSHNFSLVLTDAVDVDNMTVFELISLGRFPYTNWSGALTKEDEKIVESSMEQVSLSSKSRCCLRELSDGEKQRAIIAKALTQDTPLVLLDEPTAHLDLPNRIGVMMLLRRLSVATRKCFILSTHELDLAMQMSDEIWLMSESGVATGIPEDLMLQGVFQQRFSTANFTFDERDGHFSVNHLKGNLCVSVQGEGVSSAWLTHALERCGIRVENGSEITVFAEDGVFKFAGRTYSNIESVLAALNKI